MYKIQNILCPIDFSPASLEAIRYASIFIRQYNASLTLMYVDEFEQTPEGAFCTEPHIRQKHKEETEAFARERCSTIINSHHLKDEQTKIIVRHGAAYKEIILEAERTDYTAVILSVLGIGNATSQLIGRTAERVVRLCRVPVLTIRPVEENPFNGINSILVPTDFSEYSNYSIPYAISLALAFHAALILLHITDLTVSEKYLSQLRFPDLKIYDERAGKLVTEKLVTRDVEPDNSIVNVAEDRKVDLIVMGTHGARGMRRTKIGNTTEEVVRRVAVPVLSITHPVHKTIFPRRFNESLEEAS